MLEDDIAAEDGLTKLPDAIDSLEEEPSSTHDALFIGLNYVECIDYLVKHPDMLPRVRKIVCEEWPYNKRMTLFRRETIEKMQGKLYFPRREDRRHQMPAGNPHWRQQGMPSQWWITNGQYRRVLTRKLRELIADLKGRQ